MIALALGEYPDVYNGRIQALPIPDEAPDELPRATIDGGNGAWRLAVYPTRIDSIWSHQRDQPRGYMPPNVVQQCAAPIGRFVAENQIAVNRLGLVIKRICHLDDPADFLIDRFCNDRSKGPGSPLSPFRNSTGFEIHNSKRYEMPNGLTVNSWVRCRTAVLSVDGTPVADVEQDINTLVEDAEDRAFSDAEIMGFFEAARAEMGAILQLYFPDAS